VLAGWIVLVTATVALITVDYVRQTGFAGAPAGLAFGALMAATGLVLDSVMLVAAGFSFPGLDDERTRTVGTLMLVAYALIVVVPTATAGIAARRAQG
jgi:hypothetical protein